MLSPPVATCCSNRRHTIILQSTVPLVHGIESALHHRHGMEPIQSSALKS